MLEHRAAQIRLNQLLNDDLDLVDEMVDFLDLADPNEVVEVFALLDGRRTNPNSSYMMWTSRGEEEDGIKRLKVDEVEVVLGNMEDEDAYDIVKSD